MVKAAFDALYWILQFTNCIIQLQNLWLVLLSFFFFFFNAFYLFESQWIYMFPSELAQFSLSTLSGL